MPRPQRIAFIVPGEQSGPCGVTDYSTCLAAIPAGLGAQVLFLSIFPIAPADYLGRIPEAARRNIQVQYPSTGGKSSPASFAAALAEFSPDFVIFQFSRPVFRANRRIYPCLRDICRILRPYPVLLTVHETWTHADQPPSLRRSLLSAFRRAEILLAWKHLRLARTYASNPRHLSQLRRAGLSPRSLPIFSNIPPAPRPPPGSIHFKATLAAFGLSHASFSSLPDNPYVALFFGRISPHWAPGHLFDSLRREAQAADRSICILSVGETGYSDQGWQNVVRQAAPIPCLRLGRRSVAEIIQCLHAADRGLSPTALPYWQKSSACAAMIACQLPVVFTDTHIPSNIPLPPHFATSSPTGFVWHRPADSVRAALVTPADVWAVLARDMAAFPSSQSRP